jgi:RNA polymerase sigma factor (TIGR02999 family)
MKDRSSEVTRLLLAWREGDPEALGRLIPLVEDELHRIAERYMHRERADHTLQATALVNEVYMRLVNREQVTWRNRAHFLGFVAQTMRKILVDHARIRGAAKRQGGVKPLPLDEARDAAILPDFELIALDDALKRLARIDERQSRMVELHFFAGLTYREIGEVLGVSAETVKRDWQTARLWLLEQVRPEGSKGGSEEE